MRFIERLKKDRKFRITVVLILIVGIMVYNGGDKKEGVPLPSTCDAFKQILFTTDVNGCVAAGCGVVAYDIPFVDIFECVDIYLEGAGLQCTNSPSSRTFIAKDLAQASLLCGSGRKAIDSGESFCFKTLYQCIDVPPEEACNPSEMRLAKILYPKPFDDCKMAYYIVLFGGGIMLFAIVGMVL